MNATFGTVIADARRNKGLSQRELARLTKISNSTISRIEADDGIQHDTKTIACLAEELAIDYNYLLSLIGYVKDQPEVRAIQRAIDNMSPEQVQKMIKILNASFDDAFDGKKIGSDSQTFISTIPAGLLNNP